MKIFFSFLGILLITSCTATYQIPTAVEQNAIAGDAQVAYLRDKAVWQPGTGYGEIFTKAVSSGSGSYSEYSNDKSSFSSNSTYEFIKDGRLIGYNEHELKFTEVVYKNGNFQAEQLSLSQVRELFPDVEVVPFSSAVDGVIKVSKPLFGAKTFLLINDTDTSYYRYSFNGSCFENSSVFKSMLTVEHSGFIVFSHYGSRDPLFPVVQIEIEDGL